MNYLNKLFFHQIKFCRVKIIASIHCYNTLSTFFFFYHHHHFDTILVLFYCVFHDKMCYRIDNELTRTIFQDWLKSSHNFVTFWIITGKSYWPVRKPAIEIHIKETHCWMWLCKIKTDEEILFHGRSTSPIDSLNCLKAKK